ncbi:MAG: ABC transporter substrate-binding protein [Gammaproteobacteria bacterium]
MNIKILMLCALLLAGPWNIAYGLESLRIGVLAYGTLNWELATIEKQALGEKHGISLEAMTLASPQAAKIALQSDAVDVILADWVWVSRMRSKGVDFTFSPYSTTSGSLIVPQDSPIHSLEDLVGKRIGIAGGELDKNWLLLIALAKQSRNLDFDRDIEKIFGAPPLLNQQLLQHNLDALLTYWHYAARLEAMGYREILNGETILAGLGIAKPLPTLGYVFREQWAGQNHRLIREFLAATTEAKNLLCDSDSAWSAIAALTQAEDPETQRLFREKYCQGRIKQWTEQHKALAATVFDLLYRVAGPRLTGSSPHLAEGTFRDD